ncbi:MAG: lysostaphin resistance A-like protein [Promethearchaeota archaeon]
MNQNIFYKPLKFYIVIILAVWIPGFLAAYCSYNPQLESMITLLIAIGLISPMIITFIMILTSEKKEALKNDFKSRFFRFKDLNLFTIIMLIFFMPLSMIISIIISVLMGYPLEQFQLAPEIAIVRGQFFLSLLILILAPTLEEIGWRGYGVDALRSKYNLFKTSLIFYVIWAAWHLPLFFIKGYYQNTLLSPNPYYAVNFFLGLIPLVFIMNWLYYKSNRSIVVLIIFHFLVNLSAVLFMVDNFTKCIQTFVLLIPAIIIIWKEKNLFFIKEPSIFIE